MCKHLLVSCLTVLSLQSAPYCGVPECPGARRPRRGSRAPERGESGCSSQRGSTAVSFGQGGFALPSPQPGQVVKDAAGATLQLRELSGRCGRGRAVGRGRAEAGPDPGCPARCPLSRSALGRPPGPASRCSRLSPNKVVSSHAAAAGASFPATSRPRARCAPRRLAALKGAMAGCQPQAPPGAPRPL